MSYLEIYQEKVRDLLVEKKIEHNNEESGVNCSFRQTESSSADGRGSSFSFHGPVKKDYLRVREHPVTGILRHSSLNNELSNSHYQPSLGDHTEGVRHFS